MLANVKPAAGITATPRGTVSPDAAALHATLTALVTLSRYTPAGVARARAAADIAE